MSKFWKNIFLETHFLAKGILWICQWTFHTYFCSYYNCKIEKNLIKQTLYHSKKNCGLISPRRGSRVKPFWRPTCQILGDWDEKHRNVPHLWNHNCQTQEYMTGLFNEKNKIYQYFVFLSKYIDIFGETSNIFNIFG